MKNYPHLLRLVSLVKRSFPKHRRFNVFDSLREPHDEVRLHSRFIAALIDPDHHKLAPDALHALLRILEIPLPGQAAFSLSNARVRTEEKSIDILVTNDKQQALIIENKIHANDQDKQLRRYYQAMLGERYTDIYVVYLTLDGHEASEASLDGLSTELGPRLQNISYDYHIRTWLSEVERIAVREPYLRESVNQYAAVIDRLTGNDLPEEYMDELVAILLTNDHMKSARDIRTAYTQALIALQERVWIGLLEDFQANFPDMMAYLTDDSLSQDAVERKGIIQKFYQPSAHKRNYYGIYFGTPGYEHIAVGIEIENGLYTGAYCPPQYAEEYSRASAAIAKSGLTGHQNQSWPLWRECALWDDFLDPEERLLEILTNDASRRDAIKQCAHDVYATWQALQPVPSATVKQLGNDRKL